MQLYGLYVLQHHGSNRLLVVMSSEGVEAAREHMSKTDGLEVRAGKGRLTQYVEQDGGAMAMLIDRYDIKVLDRDAWRQTKDSLGDRWR